jgi:predicted ArsR family transcriptional regulator
VQENTHQNNPDRLNEIGVLKRREIEARILGPLLEALGDVFNREQVLEVTRQTIAHIAREQGSALAEQMGGCTLMHFADSMDSWRKDDAMEMQILEQGNERFSFNVTRCRYAEMYHTLNIPELGTLLSCSRDFRLIEGFNPEIELKRTQTIMEGAPYCDFRFDHIQKNDG